MFFLSYFFAALSFLAAPVLARYMGVVKTMAFSHGLASLIYLLLPLAPSFSIAAAMTVTRSFLAYMDNPLRSSFIMGIVRPEDRGAAAGITTLSRHVPVAVSRLRGRACRDSSGWGHVRLLPGTADGKSLAASVTLFTASGEVAAEIERLTLQAVTAPMAPFANSGS